MKLLNTPYCILKSFFQIFLLLTPFYSYSYDLDIPQIVEGDVFDDTYYHGPISVESGFEDIAFGMGKDAFYTLDACGDGNQCPQGNQCSNVGQFEAAQLEAHPGNELQVNTTTQRDQLSPSVSAFSDGSGFVMVWESDLQDGSSYGVYGRLFDQDGRPDGGEFRVNSHTRGSQKLPSVSTFSDNNGFVVTWQSQGQDDLDDPDGYGVYGQVFNRNGGRVGREFQVNTFTEDNQMEASVSTFPNGTGFIVTWSSYVDGWWLSDNNHYGIYAQFFNRNGNRVGREFLIHPNTEENFAYAACRKPSVKTFDDNSGFVVVWSWLWRTNPPAGLITTFRFGLGRSFNRDGNPLAAAFSIAGTDPSVSTFGDSSSFVVTSEDSSEIYAELFDKFRGSLGEEFQVNTTLDDSRRPFVSSSNDDRGFLITWERADDFVDVYGQMFTEDGNFLGDEFRINTARDESRTSPVSAFLSNSGFLVAWNHNDQNLDGVFSKFFPSEVDLSVENPRHRNEDLAIQFKIVDDQSGQSWCSAVRHYDYANPNSGQGGSITYPNEFTNEDSVRVLVDVPESPQPYRSLQLYKRSADLQGGNCGAFNAWSPEGRQNTLTREVNVPLDHSRCYQFKWTITNTLANSFDYSSNNILKVDRQDPAFDFQDRINRNQLILNLNINDVTSGIFTRRYRVNGEAWVDFEQAEENNLIIPLRDGANRIELAFSDRAGNQIERQFFRSIDLTPAAIHLHSLQDGSIYGPRVPIIYSLTQPLQNLRMTLDGQVLGLVEELVGLNEGEHQFSIQGEDLDGQLVSTSVNFTVEQEAFLLSFITPQNIEYDTNEISVQYFSNLNLSQVSIRLDNGNPQEDLILRDLEDGEHVLELTAENDLGEVKVIQTSFQVRRLVPSLEINEPLEGDVFEGGEIPVFFDSEFPVTYQLLRSNGEIISEGNIISGESLLVPDSGFYRLTLTATHDFNNFISKHVNFEVDTTEPDVQIISPYSGLYANRDIPIEYRSNVNLLNINFLLNGEEVESLNDLAEGEYLFEMRANDRAGREIQEFVRFNVFRLEILSPAEGENVVSNSNSPWFPFSYDASDGFNSFSFSLDRGVEQLLQIIPGEILEVPVGYGEHELRLRGRLNEFSLSQKRNFKIGRKNISLVNRSLQYRNLNCDEGLECDVLVTLQVKNDGDFDIDEAIHIRFDHTSIRGDHVSDVQFKHIDGLLIDETQEVSLAIFRANDGDQFSVSLDPEGLLENELRDDNFYSVRFSAGEIVSVESRFPKNASYLQDISFLNSLDVVALGNIDRIEFKVNDYRFIDDDGSNGWSSIIDMGLLTTQYNCVQVYAYSENQILDFKNYCFNIRKINLPDAGYQLDWGQLAPINQIIMSQIQHSDLSILEMTAIQDAMIDQELSIIPRIQENGRVSYTLFAKNVSEPIEINQGGSPLVGNRWTPPTRGAMLAININPNGNCQPLVATLFSPLISRAESDLERSTREAVEGINERVEGRLDIFSDSIDNFLGGGQDENNNQNASSFLFGGTLDFGYGFGLFYAGILRDAVGLIDVDTQTDYDDDIISSLDVPHNACQLNFNPQTLSFDFNLALSEFTAQMNSRILVEVHRDQASVFGFGSLLFWKFPIMAFFAKGQITIHAHQFDIPIRTEFKQQFSVQNNNPILPSGSSKLDMQAHYGPVKLASGEVTGYPFIPVFTYSQYVKVNWEIDILGKSETDSDIQLVNGGVEVVQNNPRQYSRFFNEFNIYKKTRKCIKFIWNIKCWTSDWNHSDRYTQCDEEGEYFPFSDSNDPLRDPNPCPN